MSATLNPRQRLEAAVAAAQKLIKQTLTILMLALPSMAWARGGSHGGGAGGGLLLIPIIVIAVAMMVAETKNTMFKLWHGYPPPPPPVTPTCPKCRIPMYVPVEKEPWKGPGPKPSSRGYYRCTRPRCKETAPLFPRKGGAA